MPKEKEDEIVAGAGLSEDPSAQDVWSQLDAEEASGGVVAREAAVDAPQDSSAADGGAVDKEPADTSADSDAADPYKDLPQAVREEILGLKATVDALSGRVRNAEGHIGGLRNQVQRDLQAAAATARQAGAEAPTQEQLASASKSPQALARLKEDYPEFGAAIEEVVQAQAQEIAKLQQAVSSAKAKPQADSEELIAKLQWQLTDVKISVKHPDWKEQVSKPDFDVWVAKQPREVQALRHSDSPEDVSRLLDIRAAQVAAAKANERNQDKTTERRLAAAHRAAAIPAGRSAASIQTKDLDDMSDAELWAYYDAQDRAAAVATR